MKIKQLKEKTIKGFIDFLPKLSIEAIPGLSDILNDKLSKSQGGEIKKPIVVTNDDSNYKIIINPDGSIYVFSKNYNENIFNIIPNGLNINISANNGIGTINIHDIVKLVSKSNKKPIYDASNNTFTASAFKLTNGTNKQVLLGDGSTISGLIKQINIDQTETDYRITIVDTDNNVKDIIFNSATKELTGLMSASDKAKLDDINKTYLPLSGGTLTGNLYVTTISGDRNGASYTNVASIQSYDQDKSTTPEVWSTDGNTIPLNKANGIPTLNSNGKIDEYKIDDLSNRYVASGDGTIYTRNYKHNGYTYLYINGSDNKIGAGGIISVTKTVNEGITEETINIDGRTGLIAAEGFKSKSEPNKDEVWTCNGSSANIRNLIAATAVYVPGSIVESIAEYINISVTVSDPDAIIFNKATGSFVAKKGNGYFRYWDTIDKLLISSTDKYGFLTAKLGIVPYHKQLYIFANDNHNIYVADNTGSVAVLDKLNIN